MIDKFKQAMRNTGIDPPVEIISDGNLHRFTVPGDKPRSKNGWYVLFDCEAFLVGRFGTWKDAGVSHEWSSREHKSLTREEKAVYTAKMEATKKQREAELRQVQAECERKAVRMWAAGRDVDAKHPYLLKKGVPSVAAKQLRDMLLIPVMDSAGVIRGLQIINPVGSKKFLTGTPKTGNYCEILGDKTGAMVLVEGWATGVSIWMATSCTIIICFDSGNLKPVALGIRSKHPDEKIILAADDDFSRADNPGLTKAREAAHAVNGLLAVPDFADQANRGTDFNDLHQIESLDRVRVIIEAAARPAPLAMEAATATSDPSSATPGPLRENEPANTQDSLENDWPEPQLFGAVDTPEIPTNLLPCWLGDFAQAVSATTQTPPALSVMFGLAALATCLQKRFEVSPYDDEYREPLNIWTVTALDPGNRKTAVRNAFCEPLNRWEQEEASRLKSDVRATKHVREINQKTIDQLKVTASRPSVTGAGREELLREIAKIESETPDELIATRLWTDDVTPERLQALLLDHGERMSLLSDEGGCFEVMSGLYSGGKANLNVFLQAHAGSPVRVDRQGRSVMLHKPALTFGLTVQPDVITELSTGNKARFRGNGTLARFLYALPKSTIGSRDVTQRIKIPDSVKRAYSDGIMGLLAISPDHDSRGNERPRILTLSPEALRAWQVFAQYIEDRQGPDGEYYEIQDWTSKLPGAALRIAGLLHVIECGESTPVIDQSTVERSLDLCDLLINHAQASFDLMGSGSANNDAQMVLRWIVAGNKRTFRQNEAYKEIRQFRQIDRLEQALRVLTGRNIISEPHHRKTGGRPSILYAVNPAILPRAKSKET